MDGVTLAHGIGGAQDLPISPTLAIAGAVAALTVSFTVLALAWRTPRFDPDTGGRAVPPSLSRLIDSTALRWALHLVGAALFAYTMWVAVFGKDLLINPVFGMFYVLLWVGLVPASILLGPVWKAISPFRTLNAVLGRVSGGDPEYGVADFPSWLGYWPGALGLFAFVWMELVLPSADTLGSVRLWIAAYVGVMAVGGAIFGNAFLEHADPFEVYSSLIARLSVWGRRDGELVVRNPLVNLAATPARPGLVAVVAVLFGSTAFDSFQDSQVWLTRTQDSAHVVALNNLALLGFCVTVGVVLTAGTVATGVGDTSRRLLPRLFAHSITPIVAGYVVAHYMTFLVVAGQTTVIQMSDPMSDGSNLFGTATWSVNYGLAEHPTLIATTKVLAVVLGHVLGVIAAHDRAIALLPKRHQLTGQLPLLAAMIGFTVSGLYLLFAA